MYLQVGRVSKVVVEDDEQQQFQRQIVNMPGDKLVTLGDSERTPIDPSLPKSPLYITLHNVTPGTNADITIVFHSGGGPFGLGGAGYAVIVVIALVAIAVFGGVVYFVYNAQRVDGGEAEVKYDSQNQQQQQGQNGGGGWNDFGGSNTGWADGGSWGGNGGSWGGGQQQQHGGSFSQTHSPYDNNGVFELPPGEGGEADDGDGVGVGARYGVG